MHLCLLRRYRFNGHRRAFNLEDLSLGYRLVAIVDSFHLEEWGLGHYMYGGSIVKGDDARGTTLRVRWGHPVIEKSRTLARMVLLPDGEVLSRSTLKGTSYFVA